LGDSAYTVAETRKIQEGNEQAPIRPPATPDFGPIVGLDPSEAHQLGGDNELRIILFDLSLFYSLSLFYPLRGNFRNGMNS
jgi:hypothetical protein